MDDRSRPAYILPLIVFSQFTGTSLWFAGNAIAGELRQAMTLPVGAVAYLTSSVQAGFIAGTLCFALLALSDRIAPNRLFCACSILGAGANLMIYLVAEGLTSLLLFRFMTGFFLAGIYPVGMKIAASWYARDLGRAIGYLVGALVLGTAFPHLINGFGQALPWHLVVIVVSLVAAVGGVLMWALVPPGPYLPRSPVAFDPRATWRLFESRDFRAASFGYFGHMWELYAFWAFVPFYLEAYRARSGWVFNVPLWAFVVIAVGFIGCAAGGLASRRFGSARVASVQLSASALCCLLSPLCFFLPGPVFFFFLCAWGMVVIGDSPQFSTLTAQTAPRERVGSALTIVNCIGFTLTIFSIQLLEFMTGLVEPAWLFPILCIGPVGGVFAVRRLNGRL